MLFGMRRWALRTLEKANVPTTSPLSTQLVSMMVQGAKVYRQDFRRTSPGIDDLEAVVMSACSMASNPTAVGRIAREIRVSPAHAEKLLAELQQVAEKLYAEERPDGHLRKPPWSVGQAPADAGREEDRKAIHGDVDQQSLYINEIWHPKTKLLFSVYVAHWLQVFLLRFGSQEGFNNTQREDQLSYLRLLNDELIKIYRNMDNLPKEGAKYNECYCEAFALQFLRYLATALAENDEKLKAKLAPFMREHAKTGWAVATAGAPQPICLIGPMTNWTK